MDRAEIIQQLAFGAVKQLVEQEKETNPVKIDSHAMNQTLVGFVQVVGCQPRPREVETIRAAVTRSLEFYFPKKEPQYVVVRRDEAGLLRLVGGPMPFQEAMARIAALYDEPEGYVGFADPVDSFILPEEGSDLVQWR